jgi:hypothetical protein
LDGYALGQPGAPSNYSINPININMKHFITCKEQNEQRRWIEKTREAFDNEIQAKKRFFELVQKNTVYKNYSEPISITWSHGRGVFGTYQLR